jgi:hypothetical protein
MKKIVIILLVIGFTSSCQTIVRGSKEMVSINTNPEGAKVTIDGNESGVTPISINLSRCIDHNIIFEKSGYRDSHILLTRKWDAFISLIAFGPLLSAIDEANCASKVFNNKEINIILEK